MGSRGRFGAGRKKGKKNAGIFRWRESRKRRQRLEEIAQGEQTQAVKDFCEAHSPRSST